MSHNGFWSPRSGTARRYQTYGLAGAIAGVDDEDAYIGSLMDVSGPAGANTANPQGQSGFWDSMIALPDYLTKILAIKQTWDVTEINKTLIRQGRPPLSTAQIQAISPRAYVGIAPDTQQLLIYGGIGLAAVMLITSYMKRR